MLSQLPYLLICLFMTEEDSKMRVAAGILMIFTAIVGFSIIRAIIGYPGSQPLASDIPYVSLLKWLSFFWAFFVGIGGIYTLKRKVWKLCLISSILQVWVIPIIPIGILPLIFICVRKREWES